MLHKSICNELVPVYQISKAQYFEIVPSKHGLAYWNSILYLEKFIEVMKVRDKSSSTAKWRDEII